MPAQQVFEDILMCNNCANVPGVNPQMLEYLPTPWQGDIVNAEVLFVLINPAPNSCPPLNTNIDAFKKHCIKGKCSLRRIDYNQFNNKDQAYIRDALYTKHGTVGRWEYSYGKKLKQCIESFAKNALGIKIENVAFTEPIHCQTPKERHVTGNVLNTCINTFNQIIQLTQKNRLRFIVFLGDVNKKAIADYLNILLQCQFISMIPNQQIVTEIQGTKISDYTPIIRINNLVLIFSCFQFRNYSMKIIQNYLNSNAHQQEIEYRILNTPKA